MVKSLLSVGLDVGTTTTQMIVSRLHLENQASSFAVPQITITDRELIYTGKVHFTPLKGQDLVDGQGLRSLIEQEYRNAGITPQDVDTGAVIITGETSRKENAKAVLENLSQIAGDFVVATAGPHLESVLAARGAGAVTLSENTDRPVLHMDIGGGTSNLCLIHRGKILRTGCLNVGGRLIKFDPQGKILYLSPVLLSHTPYRPGQSMPPQELERIAQCLAQTLAQAAGRAPGDHLLQAFSTAEAGETWKKPDGEVLVSFSGGVADCIEKELEPYVFGDIGSALGKAIRNGLLCKKPYRLSQYTIRATVIGAGCHSALLSGSTVYHQNVALPLKNLPVAVVTQQEQESKALSQLIGKKLGELEGEQKVLYFPGYAGATYAQVRALAQSIADACPEGVYVCLQQDMAKALGHCLSIIKGSGAPILCLDRVELSGDSFLDVGKPVGPCVPVVVKTLILGASEKEG